MKLLLVSKRGSAIFAGQAATAESRVTEQRWFWTTLLGAAMTIGSALALAIAATTVVLPYDESFCGLTREQLLQTNSKIIGFLAHDRVSLAGTMLSCGILYLGLSLMGVRRGFRWAEQAIFISSFVGFSSFFLFLGFGYFDPFHAFVTAVLLQLMFMAILAKPVPAASRRDIIKPTAARWGQRVLILHSFALLAGGLVFVTLGSTRVFVPTDLTFMATTDDALRLASPRLIPLIAHDRATLGGMLLANGIVFLISTWRGFQPDSAWLWWTWLCAVTVAYGSTIAVHFGVGYTDFEHLLPAYVGTVLSAIGLLLSRRYMMAST